MSHGRVAVLTGGVLSVIGLHASQTPVVYHSAAGLIGSPTRMATQGSTNVAPQDRPTFRAGVDLVTFDVVVLDKDRHPVRGLTTGDFVVRESGDPQDILSVSEVVSPSADRSTAAWTRDVGPDVVSNDVAGKRFVVL